MGNAPARSTHLPECVDVAVTAEPKRGMEPTIELRVRPRSRVEVNQGPELALPYTVLEKAGRAPRRPV